MYLFHVLARMRAWAAFCLCASILTPLHTTAQTIAPPALELVVLGSGGPGAVGRASSSFAILLDGKPRILVDAGPGAFARVGEEKLSLRDLDIVLLTHLHVDHAAELPGLVKARAVSIFRPIKFRVFGPSGAERYPSTRRFIDLLFGEQGAFGYLSDFSAPVSFDTTDIDGGKEKPTVQLLVSENGLRISAIVGHHRDAPSVIYRVDYHGHSLTFSGDIDAEGLPMLRILAKGTDLLVFNSVVLDPPDSPEQLYELHTPPREIGEMARDTGAKQLLLNHLSPAVDNAHEAVLTSIRKSFSGNVVFSRDRLHMKF